MKFIDIIKNLIRKYNSDVKEPINMESTIVPYIYKSKFFRIEEFVDRATFKRRGNDAFGCMDIRIIITADNIREYFGKPMTINNWHSGGEREWSGIRTKDSPYYSYDSQHSFGRAIDFIIPGIEAQEIRNVIKSNPNHEAFKYITRIEEFSGMGWCHVDCKMMNRNNGIYVFKP